MGIDFGREVCGFLPASERREWLVTSGIGGYACGTISGMATRRYHGLLIAATQPPVGRTLLVTGLLETALYDELEYELSTTRLDRSEVEPEGYQHIERFRLEGTIPVWTFAFGDAQLEKRVWMQHGANTTYIQYHLVRALLPVKLNLAVMVNHREAHATSGRGTLNMQAENTEHGVRITPQDGDPFFVLTDRAHLTNEPQGYTVDQYLSIEAQRGFRDVRDFNLCAGHFAITLEPDERFCVVASTHPAASLDGKAAYQERREYEHTLIETAHVEAGEHQRDTEQLVLAADQFIVQRATPDNPNGHTIIAGYPWFADWGRDTMISLPGLALATRRYDIAVSILRTFAHYADQGMLPNHFPEAGETPEYNTADASLWYFEAIRAYVAATQDTTLLRELMPILRDIINWHVQGTRYGIHRTDDGLLHAGEPGVQLTWMDVKIDDWVVTPRTGKPVEINALWYNALHSMADFEAMIGGDAEPFAILANQAQAGFTRLWNAEAGCCYDVIDGPNGDDASLRPNQLFAVSLHHSPLPPDQQRAVVEVCARHLLTSHGLRSLSPDHPDYAWRYRGSPKERDAVYHQGTVWGWLIGPFVSAHFRVYQDREAAMSFITPMLAQMRERSVGTLSEVYDGGAPHDAHGCLAQAWSVAEVLRVLHQIAQPEIAM
jgi:predicted glycogen debranching enzyme